MQTHGGANAEAAILSSERRFIPWVVVDWNKNTLNDNALSVLAPYVDTVSVDRSLSGSAPEEILLVEGSSAAELTMTLSGEYQGQPIANLFSPFNKKSPLFGKPLVGSEVIYQLALQTPVGEIVYPQFVGEVRTVTPDRANNTVEITALDRSEKLRKPIQLPPWAVSDEHMNYGETESQLAYSHWVIDTCLRLCDVGHGDKRPTFREEMGVPDDGLDGVLLYITGNGSYLPTIGYVDNLNASTFPTNGTAMYRSNAAVNIDLPSDTAKPMGLAGLGTPIRQRYGTPGDQGIIRYWAVDQDRINPVATHYIGFTLNTSGTNGSAFQTIAEHVVFEVFIGMGRSLEVLISNGQVWTARVNHADGGSRVSSSKVNIPTGQNNVDVWVQWDNTSNTGSRAYVRAGTNTTGYVTVGSPVTSGSNAGADQIKGRVTIGQALNISDIMYSVRNIFGSSANESYQGWRRPKYQAVLDTGINRLSHIPSSQAQEAWEVIKGVAAAEFGSVFWDESGRFRFWNLPRILAMQSNIVRKLTLDDVSELKMTHTLDSVRNVYVQQTEKKRSVYGGAVYDSNDPMEFYVPPQTTKRFRIFQDDILSPLTFFMTKHSSDPTSGGAWPWIKWDDNVTHGYGVQYLVGGLWQEMNSRTGLDIGVYFTTQGFLTVRIYNGWTEPVRLATGAGENSEAAFRVSGTKIVDGDPVSILCKHIASVATYGARTFELSSEWHQDTDGAHDIALALLDRTSEPTPTTDAITIAGDPRLQLGDCIEITDPEGFGTDLRFQIYGINRVYSAEEGLTDTLTVEMTGQA